MTEKKENAFSKLWHNTNGKIGLIILGVILLLALLAPVLTPYDPLAMNVGPRLAPPSLQHWMGTDEYGRDTFSRILYGARSSLGIGVNSVAIAALLGINIGMFAGFFGGAFDNVSMRLMDAVIAFPATLLAIVVIAILGTSSFSATLAIAIVNVPSFARLTRSSILRECNCGYVAAARALGYGRCKILYQEILPNIQSTLFVQVTVSIASAILLESALSFLGLGISEPTASWGSILQTGKNWLNNYPYIATYSGLFILITVLGFNLLGDGVRDVLDPKMKK